MPAALRDAAIEWLRLQRDENIAAALPWNAAQVPKLLWAFGVLKQ